MKPQPQAPETSDADWMHSDYQPGLVSTIIPTFNRGRLIAETLDSVARQTYRPIEIIVVDDGSEDDTRQVVLEFQASFDKGISLSYVYQDNQGAPVARNRGYRESRGEFVRFLDSDDLVDALTTEKQIGALAEEPLASVAYGPWRCLYADTTDKARRKYGPQQQTHSHSGEEEMLRGYLSSRWYCPMHSYLFRRSALIEVGAWDVLLLRRQDTDFITRALLCGCRFIHTPGAEVLYRRQSGDHIGHASRFDRQLASMLYLTKKQHQILANRGLWSQYREELQASLASLADDAAVLGSWSGERQYRELMVELFDVPSKQRIRAALRRLCLIVIKGWIATPVRRTLGEYYVASIKQALTKLI